MKHKILICTLILAAMLLAGCAQDSSQQTYIGAEAAKSLALEAASLDLANVEFDSTDMSTRNGIDYYLVSFSADGAAYSYAIDALTGVILEEQTVSASGSLTGSSAVQTEPDSGAADQTVPSSTATASDTASSSVSAESGGTAGTGTANTGTISLEDAKTAALSHAGFTSSQVTFVKGKLDYENGRQVYEIEFYTQDYREYDYEIDAATGEIVSYDYDAENYLSTASLTDSAMTAEEAKALALAQVPGASESDIWEFETDYDDGRIEYEGKILYNGMEYEFEIDAYSGAFRSWEAERCSDHRH